MRIRVPTGRIALALSALVTGCGTTTEPLAACSTLVTVTVSGGTAPIINWTPACGAERLVVVRPLAPGFGIVGEESLWVIVSGDRLIEPGVRYGARPRGTVLETPPRELVAGQTYAVSVRMGVVIGLASFTP